MTLNSTRGVAAVTIILISSVCKKNGCKSLELTFGGKLRGSTSSPIIGNKSEQYSTLINFLAKYLANSNLSGWV